MFGFYFFSSICQIVFGILYFFSPWFFVKGAIMGFSSLFSVLIVVEKILEVIRYCIQFGVYFFNSFVTSAISSFVYYFGIIPPSQVNKAGEEGNKVISLVYEIFEFHTGNFSNLEMVVPNTEIHLAYFYKFIVFISFLVCWFCLWLFLIFCFAWIYIFAFGAYFFWVLISNIYTFFFSGLIIGGARAIDLSLIYSFPYSKYIIFSFYLFILLFLPPFFYFTKFYYKNDDGGAHLSMVSFSTFAFIYYKFFIYYFIELARVVVVQPINKLLTAFSVRLAFRINVDDLLGRSLIFYFNKFKVPYFRKFNTHRRARGGNDSKLDPKLKEKVMEVRSKYYL